MSADAPAEPTIRSLFESIEKKRKSLDSYFDSNSDAYQAELNAAISELEQCKDLVSRASLFSMNESLEDVSTGDLRYLVVDHLLGELILKRKSQNRKHVLEQSRRCLKGFLELCDAYGLLSESDKSAAEGASSNSLSISSLPSDPGARRQAKIAQFKREKELKTKVESLSASTDDEDARIFHKSYLELLIVQTIQTLEMIKLELDLLSKAPPPEETVSTHEKDDRKRTKGIPEYNEKLDVIDNKIKGGALLSSDGKPLRPFVLLDKREQLKAGVFRPSHSLPTMTIDEYLDEERRRGGIIEGGGEKSGIKPEADEDDYEEADKATMKAREWDEYTEANPRGWGNTLNKG